MTNHRIAHYCATLTAALFICLDDAHAIREFRRFLLNSFGVSVGRVDVFTCHFGQEFDFCYTSGRCHFYLAARTVTADFLDCASALARVLEQRLVDIYEHGDLLLLQDLKGRLSPDERIEPSQEKLQFCAQHYGLNPSLAKLACVLASGQSLDHAQQQLQLSKQTLRTYQQRLTRQMGVANQQALQATLSSGPLACLK
ncbi:MAG: hypothetical protein RL336_525 [Pseudomonadota bacterium]